MGTMLFNKFDPSTESSRQFLRDLTGLLKLPSEKMVRIGEEFLKNYEIVSKTTKREKEASAKKVGISLAEINSCLDVTEFLVRRLSDEECQDDRPEELASDLKERAPSVDIEKQRLIELFSYLKEKIIPPFEAIRKKRIFSAGVIPSLRGFDSTVEVRAVIEEEFEVGMSAKDYKPTISGYVPIVSVRLQTDSETLNEFVFQTSPEGLELFKEGIEAALVEVKALKKFLEKA